MKNSINQLDLTDICKALHPAAAECVFANACGVFSRKENTLGHKKVSMSLKELKSDKLCSMLTMELSWMTITKEIWEIDN